MRAGLVKIADVYEYTNQIPEDMTIAEWMAEQASAALSDLPQQVKSEILVGVLHINEYREYYFVPADLITLERALPVGAYELTAAISAQENKS